MADVFISYARSDRDRVEDLAAALEQAGLSLWWDRQIKGGDEFSTEIERELMAAGAVIVGWSAAGSKSNWVKDEAAVAADRGCLVAVSLDGSLPPIGFRQYHCIDLSNWNGGPDAPVIGELRRTLDARRRQATDAGDEDGPASVPRAVPKPKPKRPMGTIALISLVAALACVTIAFLALRGPGAPNTGAGQIIDDKSIAVLPFATMSTNEADVFLSEGLSEELLNVLSRIDDLKVASRTSSFAFQDSDLGVQEIGRQLNVAHVLEGSVRRAGERLRITAQLIAVDDGYHLWSETYDRESTDVIEIQDDIARRVSLALQSALVGQDGETLTDVGTNNGAAYRLYLEGRALLNRRGLEVARAISRLEEAVALDPEYGRAYAALASAHLVSSNYLRTPTAISHQRAGDNARRAMALDATLAEPLAVLAAMEMEVNAWEEAIDLFDRAEALDPEDVVTLQWSGEAHLYLGYINAAQAKLQRALELEPESPILNLIMGNIYHALPDLDQAEAYFRLAERYGAAHAVLNRGLIEFERGDVGEASRDFARNMVNMQFLAPEDEADLATFLNDIITGEKTVDGNIDRFPALAADEDFRSVLYLYAGEAETALKLIALDADRDKDTFYKAWSDLVPGMRQQPYFRTFAEETGLLAYWKKHGWPDKCRPVGEDDFECW